MILWEVRHRFRVPCPCAVTVRCSDRIGRDIRLQVKKTQMQLCVPQMTLDPLLMRHRLTRGTPLDHHPSRIPVPTQVAPAIVGAKERR